MQIYPQSHFNFCVLIVDKEIMNRSNSSISNDFNDLMSGAPEKFVPSYDFMSIRSDDGSWSPPADRSLNFDSQEDNSPLRTWISVDSKIDAASNRNYAYVDVDKPSKSILGKNENPSNRTLDFSMISEIDKTMEIYMENLLNAVDSMNARLSQLETMTCNLERSIDDLKMSGNIGGRMGLLEDTLREVQSSVLVIKEKQESLEGRLEIGKLEVPRMKEEVESKNTTQIHQQSSAVSPPQPPSTLSLSNIPPPLPQLPNEFPQTQFPWIPQQESYIPLPSQNPESLSQHYQMLPLQPQHAQHLTASRHSLPHPSFSLVNLAIPPPQLGHHRPEEVSYIVSPTYSPSIHLPPHPPSSQQYYRPNAHAFEPPSNRPGTGYPGSFGPQSGHVESYSYSNFPSRQDNTSSSMKPQLSSPSMRRSGGTDYPLLPTAQILLPTASPLHKPFGSSGSDNRAPLTDGIIQRVTNMGFPIDHVRATVQKLTESGQAVDLNIVIDKLMNE